MFQGLWKLTWLELKIFLREPMGAVTSLLIPVVMFLGLGRGVQQANKESFDASEWIATSLPVLVIMIIALNGVVSLVTIMSIYREGGILKRLKATPLRPYTILTAHVLVKLLLTSANILILIIAGKTFFAINWQGGIVGFVFAVILSTTSILSIGFIIASMVRTARFAQMVATMILYPLLGLSGLFVSIDEFPGVLRTLALLSPLTHAVRLTEGAWNGEPLGNYVVSIAMLVGTTIACVLLSSKVFRWE